VVYQSVCYLFKIVYGTQPFHWYFSNGVTLMLSSQIPLVIYGIYKSNQKQKYPFYLIVYTIIMYSFLKHKEYRFIYPIFPLFMIYNAIGNIKIRFKLRND
jgi:GPI mannosyltransferase 3